MPRETPVGEFWVRQESQPSTPIQALMEAAPGEDPEESALEGELTFMERVIALCADEFTSDELEILAMHFVRKMSVREIADAMGTSKDTLHRRLVPLKARLVETAKERA